LNAISKVAPVIMPVTTSRHVQIVQLRRFHPHLSASMPIAQSSINRYSPLTKQWIQLMILIGDLDTDSILISIDTPFRFL